MKSPPIYKPAEIFLRITSTEEITEDYSYIYWEQQF